MTTYSIHTTRKYIGGYRDMPRSIMYYLVSINNINHAGSDFVDDRYEIFLSKQNGIVCYNPVLFYNWHRTTSDQEVFGDIRRVLDNLANDYIFRENADLPLKIKRDLDRIMKYTNGITSKFFSIGIGKKSLIFYKHLRPIHRSTIKFTKRSFLGIKITYGIGGIE